MYRYKTFVLFVIFSCLIVRLQAQDNNIFFDLESKEQGQGKVNIEQDPAINELISKHIESNKRSEGIPGYRIRIFSKSGNTAREEMNAAKARFLKIYPDIRAYEDYDQVNFKLYVGDFQTRSEALKIMHSVEGLFQGLFIVQTIINYQKPQQN